MPTAFGADGKIQVAWYDTRREAAELAAASQVIDPNIPYVADHVDTDLVTLGYVQRKVDVYTTRFTAAQLAAEAASPNSPDGIPDAVRASQYSIVLDDSSGEIERFETEASFANKKLFGQGKLPFLGDYIALSARQFRQTANGKWDHRLDGAAGVPATGRCGPDRKCDTRPDCCGFDRNSITGRYGISP
jgi:hypothetical protein